MAPFRNSASSRPNPTNHMHPFHFYINPMNPLRFIIIIHTIKMDNYSFFTFSSFSNIQITDEEFNLFHSIDRLLFCRLIHTLRRDVNESMRVLAFLIWLERARYSHNSVKKVLDWPLLLLDELCNEIAVCLSCLKKDELSYTVYNSLSSLRKLCRSHISFYHFHENRSRVIGGVSEIMDGVCVRAFEDILSDYPTPRFGPVLDFYESAGRVFPRTEFGGNMNFQHVLLPNKFGNLMREDLNTDLSEIFGGMKLVDGCEEEKEVEPGDRTIFLTFSKGYYIAECEIRDYFTRIFGDFIEAIYMQDVSPNEQPLYARMVARSSSIIPAISPEGSKAKYSINGKHIWAKKYVKKNRPTTSSVPEPNSPGSNF